MTFVSLFLVPNETEEDKTKHHKKYSLIDETLKTCFCLSLQDETPQGFFEDHGLG